MKKTPMTAEGASSLQEELYRLKNIERPRVIRAIREAREHGDLRENAEYAAAKEQQGFIECKIKEIESKLATAHLIDIKEVPWTGRVIFGSTVTLKNLNTEDEVHYRIVGEDEADLRKSKISVTSPTARAVIGKREGEIVLVNAPGGQVEYEILTVRYV